MILDEPDMVLPRPSANGRGWIVSYTDLITLLLTFFVLLFTMSSNDPSRVESAVSSLTEKFARSAVESEMGSVASESGTVVLDQEYLDSVVTAIKGRDSYGQVKILRSEGGTLVVRLERDKIFLPRTGVLSPDGLAIINDIARSMLRRNSGITLSMSEIRVIGTPQEYAEKPQGQENEAPVIIRQASRIARTLMDAKVPSRSLTTVMMEDGEPGLVMAFYSLTPSGIDAADDREPS